MGVEALFYFASTLSIDIKPVARVRSVIQEVYIVDHIVGIRMIIPMSVCARRLGVICEVVTGYISFRSMEKSGSSLKFSSILIDWRERRRSISNDNVHAVGYHN